MSVKLKKRLTYGTILLFNLFTGLGYAIIFPTIWNYIHKRLKGESDMLGIIIAAYSLSSFFANPLIGWWNDKSLNTKMILLVTILAEMIGSLLYFVGMHTWVLIIGRLISGVGAGGGAAVLADITRTTSEDERTPVLSVVIASRQLGLIFGPAFNIFLSKIDFSLFSLPVDEYSSPGLFMAFLWLCLEIIVLFCYTNLTTLKDNEEVEKLFENYNSGVTGSIPYAELDNQSTLEVAFTSSYPPYSGTVTPNQEGLAPPTISLSASQPNLHIEWLEDSDVFPPLRREEIESIHCQAIVPDSEIIAEKQNKLRVKRLKNLERQESVSDTMIESAERLILSSSGSYRKIVGENVEVSSESTTPKRSSSPRSTPYSSAPVSLPDETSHLLGHVRKDYFRDEIIVLLGLAFISCFAQTVLETVVTPLAQKYYNFTEMDNSYIYLVAGIEVILVYAVIKYASKQVSDRSFIIFGLFTLIVAMILPIIYVPSAVPGDNSTLYYFITTIVVDLIGIAIIVVCSASLLSKITDENSQALFQGFRRSMCSLGCIVGPIWGGAYLLHVYALFSIPLAVIVFITVLFVLSYKKFNIERL
ncbi:uncharacterized protein [Parasteatoda tepidariorum]|uniref:uncharacterized protein n=1 Tax=Parasteatoda tepidariorum TaxID=114398 RepID=UPI001C72013A|nr:uncharacterized protein LOC107446701 [Parasteatoda tepidariorum]